MPNCGMYNRCGLDDAADPAAGFCILHSRNPQKDRGAFETALTVHRRARGDDFTFFTFPAGVSFYEAAFAHGVSFSGATFLGDATFVKATFGGEADFTVVNFAGKASFNSAQFLGEGRFSHATFTGDGSFYRASFAAADFRDAKFTGNATFLEAQFTGKATFRNAGFAQEAHFWVVTFADAVDFLSARFSGMAHFYRATFAKDAKLCAYFYAGADFQQSTFTAGPVSFLGSTFQGTTLFVSGRSGPTDALFSGVEVDFREVVVQPPEALVFRNVDLRRCRLLDTDFRKAELTDVLWPRIGPRFGVYDEMAPLAPNAERPWGRIERLYRELKQNHEDRHDYERAGDFHYGEKEMRRRNPRTPTLLRGFLTAYACVSGYGENYLRPLLWAALLLLGCAYGYLVLGLSPKAGGPPLGAHHVRDWLRSVHYSFQLMTLLKPEDLVPTGWAKPLTTFQSLLGPLLLGFFGLALRQRLKR